MRVKNIAAISRGVHCIMLFFVIHCHDKNDGNNDADNKICDE